MSTFLIIIGVIGIIAGVIWIISNAIKRHQKNPNAKFKPAINLTLLAVIVLFVGCMLTPSGNSSSSEKPTTHHISKKQKEKNRHEAEVRLKNEKRNYANLKKAVKNLPKKTKGEISDTKVSKADGIVHIGLMLSSKFDSLSDDELKPNVKNAWKLGVGLFNQYSPYDNGAHQDVEVFDDTGNVLGKTSTFSDNFKYKG